MELKPNTTLHQCAATTFRDLVSVALLRTAPLRPILQSGAIYQSSQLANTLRMLRTNG